jgi:predicted acylesterase/phospholipase RssA
LVLGGGGITGIAWELGMLAGLAEHGIDLRDADLVVGTSVTLVDAVAASCSVPRVCHRPLSAGGVGSTEACARRPTPI